MELITQKKLLSTLARANLVGAFYSSDADVNIAFRFKNLGKYILFSSVPTWEKVKVSGGEKTIGLGQGIHYLSAYGQEITVAGQQLMMNDNKDQTVTLTVPRWTHLAVYQLDI